MYDYIDYDVTEHIATVFLNRPAKKNAYTPRMGVEIVAAMEAAMADGDVRVLNCVRNQIIPQGFQPDRNFWFYVDVLQFLNERLERVGPR